MVATTLSKSYVYYVGSMRVVCTVHILYITERKCLAWVVCITRIIAIFSEIIYHFFPENGNNDPDAHSVRLLLYYNCNIYHVIAILFYKLQAKMSQR